MIYMYLSDKLKSNIHLYVILELAIKSVQHDQKLFESFKIKRPYLLSCDQQLSILRKEFKKLSKELFKQGVRYEKYQCISKNECMYYFMCRGEIIPFHYYGDVLKEQVERKIKLVLTKIKEGKSA